MARKEKKRRKMEEKENREIELFADDLIRFMLSKQLRINYAYQIRREPGEQASNLNRYIDVPLCIIGETLRSLYYRYFFHQGVLEIHDLDSIARYYSTYVENLTCVNDCHVFDKLLVLASVTVELAAYCFRQGNRVIVHHAPKLYFHAFCQFKKDFFDNGGWNALNKLIQDETRFYTESKLKQITGNAQTNVTSEWTRRTSKRLSLLNRTAISFAIKLHHGDRNYAFAAFMLHLKDLRDPNIQCSQSIDCPEAKEWRLMADQIMFIFKLLISPKKNEGGYQELCSVLNNKTKVHHLLRYCMFTKLINGIIVEDIYNRIYDILHFVTQLLSDNPHVAYFCIDKMQDIYKIAKRKELSQKHPEGMSCDETLKGFDLTETNSDVTSCKLSSNKNDTTSELEAHKILLSRYLNKIAPKDKPKVSESVQQILDILSDEDDSSILLNCEIFREIINMRVTLQNNHFDETWTRQAMEILLKSLKPSERSSTQVDNATKTNSSANEVSTNRTDPKVTELKLNTVPTTVTETTESSISYSHETIITETVVECNDQNVETAQSSVCSTSSHKTGNMEIVESNDLTMKSIDTPVSSTSRQETLTSETVEGVDLNMETTHTLIPTSSHESVITRIDEDDNQKVEKQTNIPYESIHKCTVCSQCLDHNKNEKKTVRTGQSIEIFIPLRKRKDLKDMSASQSITAAPEETKQYGSEITYETSVHEQNSPASENPNSTDDYTILFEDLAISDSSDSS